MTAHGLGAFVGWAAFAVMGFAWWVLAEVGFPIGSLGAALARAAFWCMVVGVAGVVVTTLVFSFAGSWVFLYPLPFHGAGPVGRLGDRALRGLGAAGRRRRSSSGASRSSWW